MWPFRSGWFSGWGPPWPARTSQQAHLTTLGRIEQLSLELKNLAAASDRVTAVLASMEAARIAEREHAAALRATEDAAAQARLDEVTAKLNAALDALATAPDAPVRPAPAAVDGSAPTGPVLTPAIG